MSSNRGRMYTLPVALAALAAGAPTLTAQDCNLNGIPDACDLSCGESGGPCDVDECGESDDCNVNDVPDECELTHKSALDFGGNHQRVRVARTPLLEPTDELTIEAWVWADSVRTGHQSRIVRTALHLLSWTQSESLSIEFHIAGASEGSCQATDPTPVSAYFGQWTHVAGVYSATQNLCQLYVNGELRADESAVGTLQYAGSDLYIGNYPIVGDGFDGLIDEVRVWSVARSAGELNATKDTFLVGTEAGLVGYWRFDEAAGQTAFDFSSHGHHGTLGNGGYPGSPGPEWVTDGAPFTETDCNGNEILDECDVAGETSTDCNVSGTPDECEPGGDADCDGDGESDLCEIVVGGSEDCNDDNVPDECESQEDCNDNGVQDICDTAADASLDCNHNGAIDACELAAGTVEDCNTNGVPDSCDIAGPTSTDFDRDRVPDECQTCEGFLPPFSGPLATLKAVAINGEPIEPTNCAIVAPGDLIEAEFFVSGWGPAIGDLRSYQVKIAGRRGAFSGEFGLVLPVGWDAPPLPDFCRLNEDCPPDLNCVGYACVRPSHNPSEGAFLDRTREDYVLAGFDVVHGIGTPTLDYIYFAVGVEVEGVPDPGEPRYAGTLLLEVSDDACGRFTFGFDEHPGATVFVNPIGGTEDDWVEPYTWPLFIETPSCDCNHNSVRDDEEISAGEAFDCDGDGVLDECEPDCNANGVPDDCELADCADEVWCEDCNSNGVLDECDIADGTLTDADGNGIPDSCFIPIPTVSQWGLVAMTLILLTTSKILFGHRRRTS